MSRDFDLKDQDIELFVSTAQAHVVENGIDINMGETSMDRMEEAVDDVKEIMWLCGGECVTSDEAIKQLQADIDFMVIEIALLLHIKQQLTTGN